MFLEYKKIDYSVMRSNDFIINMNKSNINDIKRVLKGHGFKNFTNCDLCNSVSFKKYLTKNKIDIVKCNNCNLVLSSVYPHNVDDLYSDTEYENITNKNYGKNLKYRENRFGMERLNILRNYKSSGNLLDVGSGLGWFIELAKKYYEVSGVELSDNLRNTAIKKGLKIYKQLEEINEQYEIITMFDCLEHVISPSALLKEIYELLKPGGIALIFTPNVNSVGFHVLKEYNSLVCPPAHLYYFSMETASRLAEKSNLRIIEIYTKGIDVGDIYALELMNGNNTTAKYLNDNQIWLQHSIDEAGFGNHMRIILQKGK